MFPPWWRSPRSKENFLGKDKIKLHDPIDALRIPMWRDHNEILRPRRLHLSDIVVSLACAFSRTCLSLSARVCKCVSMYALLIVCGFWVCGHVWVCVGTSECVCLSAPVWMCVCSRAHNKTRVCVSMCVCINVCMCVCKRLCVNDCACGCAL